MRSSAVGFHWPRVPDVLVEPRIHLGGDACRDLQRKELPNCINRVRRISINVMQVETDIRAFANATLEGIGLKQSLLLG